MNASAWYVVDEPLQGPYTFIFFFYDYMNITGFLGSSCASVSEGPPYVYKGSLGWGPEVVGSHELIAGVVNGTIYDVIAGMYGVGIRASEAVDLEVQGCPSNLVVHYPQVVYDDVLSITATFSMPRVYSVTSTDFYVATTLAPEFTYNEVDYMIDEPVDSVPVELYADGDLVSVNQTNEDGLAFFSLGLDFSDAHFASNITAVVDDAVLFESLMVERFVSFTRVGVSDVASGGSDFFQLNYTLNEFDSEDGVYVGTDNLLKADVGLFNQSIWNVPVSVTSARFVSSCKTQMDPLRVGSIPTGSDYLRVTSFYDTRALVADVAFRDGKVNLYDAVVVTTAYGSSLGDSNWNPDADLAAPWGKIDIYDVVVVLSHYGESGDYYPPQGLYILFDNGQRVDVDSSGCASIPSGATSFNVCRNAQVVGAFVEFFVITFDEVCWTNNIGTIATVWKPMETGTYLLQVKLPSCFTATTTFWSDVTEVDASLNIVDYYLVEKRPIELSVDYVPEQPTLDDEVTMIANVFDMGLEEPAENLKVEFYVYRMQEGDWLYMDDSLTNSSGVAMFTWTPNDYLEETGGLAYFVLSVRVVETAYTAMAEVVPVSVDTRYLTGLEFLMGGDTVNVAVGEESHLYVKLVRACDGSPIDGVYVNLYIDGVKTSWALTGATGFPGVAEWWPWVVEEEGVYYYTVRFENWDPLYQPSNEARLVVVAEVVPMNILFDVQPRDFKPGTSLTLTVQVNDSRSGEPLSGRVVKFYAVDEDGDKGRIDDGSIATDENGVATLIWTYAVGPWAFVVEVATGQSMMSSPVMLTVAKETGLSLDVEKDESSFEYTFSGYLLSYGEAVLYRQVKILVNDTAEAVLDTNPDGSFSVTLNLQPADNKPTAYNVQAVFEGDEPCSATAYALTPNGTEYAVCTTVQYGFKPSTNSTWLTVEPQSTQVMQPTKTPKQLQAEAENSGWLSIWHEFSWWYPWYRLHFIGKYSGETMIDIGIAVLPFAVTDFPKIIGKNIMHAS